MARVWGNWETGVATGTWDGKEWARKDWVGPRHRTPPQDPHHKHIHQPKCTHSSLSNTCTVHGNTHLYSTAHPQSHSHTLMMWKSTQHLQPYPHRYTEHTQMYTNNTDTLSSSSTFPRSLWVKFWEHQGQKPSFSLSNQPGLSREKGQPP